MTREEHLKFCKKCLNRKMDLKTGIICNLTQEKADFENECSNFQIDESVKEPESIVEEDVIVPGNSTTNIDDNIIEKLRSHQDFYYGTLGGILAMIVGAVIWAVITVATKYQIGYMAIGVGLLVGFTIQFFGAGIDKKFGILGAVLSLGGCLLGNLFSQVGFIANEQSLGYFETLTYLDFNLAIGILTESFRPMDVVFYGIAVYEGYKFAFRRISVKLLSDLKSGKQEGYPANQKFRMPLAVSCVIIISVMVFSLMRGVNGHKTYYYENGKVMSEGELHRSKEQGKWTYYYENGQVQLEGYYQKGNPDSLWTWYDELGQITKSGSYKNGIEDGIWISYFSNGKMSDSGSYVSSRMNGFWKYWYESGAIYQTGYFHRNAQDSIWKTYYENGQLSSMGNMDKGELVGKWVDYYENGQIAKESYVDDSTRLRTNNFWNSKGKQIIKNGNGVFKSYADNGQLIEIGTIEEGLRKGLWKTYYNSGTQKEEIQYVGDYAEVKNCWDKDGTQTITDGNGILTNYYLDSESVLEKGELINGRREGLWRTFYYDSQEVYQESNYTKGELSGSYVMYFQTGQICSKGEMINGVNEGEWEWYHENGNLSSVASFKNGKKQGKQTLWSETGELTKEEYYENGEMVDEIYL